jgi:hypothetical protein
MRMDAPAMVPKILMNSNLGAYARMSPNMNEPMIRNAPYMALAL